jgi:hypothetical protein
VRLLACRDWFPVAGEGPPLRKRVAITGATPPFLRPMLISTMETAGARDRGPGHAPPTFPERWLGKASRASDAISGHVAWRA